MSNEVKTPENESAVTTPTELQKLYLRPAADVYRDEHAVRILLDVPGADEGSLNVSVHDGTLSIQAEVLRSDTEQRVYERAFQVDRRMDTSQIEATLQHGVLQLRIPFHEEARPRRIEVKSA